MATDDDALHLARALVDHRHPYVALEPLEAGGPAILGISDDQGAIQIADVLVGEVWVGSGQSNMAGGVGGYAKRDATLAKLVEGAPYPKIRLLKGGPKPTWIEATPETVPGPSMALSSSPNAPGLMTR